MDNLDTISYIYPYDYNNTPSSGSAPFEKIPRATSDLMQGLGWTALAAMTGGIATGRFENEIAMRPATEKQIRALGGTSLSYLTHIEQPNIAVNETAILGYSNAQAA